MKVFLNLVVGLVLLALWRHDPAMCRYAILAYIVGGLFLMICRSTNS